MTRLISSLFATALLASCVGDRSLTSQLCPCAPGWSCDPSTNTCVASNGADGSCSATCSTPAGTVEVLSFVDQVYAAVAGTWQICTDMAEWQVIAPSDVIGIEFGPVSGTVGGDGYFLVQGPSGPVPGNGSAYQFTYDVLQLGTQSFQVSIQTAKLFSPYAIRNSTCPTEVELSIGEDHSSVLVPF